MSLLMKLNFILIQKPVPKEQYMLEQILLILKELIIQEKLSRLWITCEGNSNDNEEEENNFIKIIKRENNYYIQINVGNNTGKNLLTKIICLVSNHYNNKYFPFLLILEKENINLRKILYNYNISKIRDSKTFTFMMRSFVIVNRYQHKTFGF